MKKILIVRHGKTESYPDLSGFKGRHPVGLCPEGAYTLACVAVLMKATGFHPDVIFSSTINRAIQSASLFNHQQEPQVSQYMMANFDEVEPGSLVSQLGVLSLAEYDELAPSHGAETSQQVISRFLGGLQYVGSLEQFNQVLIVSHSFLMHTVYANMLKENDLPEWTFFDHGCGFWVELEPTPRITGLFPNLSSQSNEKESQDFSLY